MSEASNHGRVIMEVMLAENRAFASSGLPDTSSGVNDGPGVSRELNAPPFQASAYGLASKARFRRHIEVRNYSQVTDSASVRLWKDEVRQVSVTILWHEGGRQHSLEVISMSRRPR